MTEKKLVEITEHVRKNLLKDFDEFYKPGNKMNEQDFMLNLAKDRKAAGILKSIQMEIQKEIIDMRKGKIIPEIEEK